MAGFWDWLFGGGGKKEAAPKQRAEPARRSGGGSFEAPARSQGGGGAPRASAAPPQQGGGSSFLQPSATQQQPSQGLNFGGLPRGGGSGGMFAMGAPVRSETSKGESPAPKDEKPDAAEPAKDGLDSANKEDKKGVAFNPFDGGEGSAAFWNFILKTPGMGMPDPVTHKFPEARENPVQRQATQTIRSNAEAEEARTTKDSYSSALGSLTTGEDGRLTWDQYNALTPVQRNAVDANEAILQAIEADKADKGAGAKPDDWNYDETVERLFGREGGSDTYAPRTVKALDTLGLTNPTKGDLDNYLDGGALISLDDLSALGADRIGELQGRGTESRSERENNALAFSGLANAKAAETLAQGQTLLQALSGNADIQPGFNPLDDTGMTQDLDAMFQTLSHRNSDQIDPNDISQAYAEMEGLYGVNRDQISQYFNTRLQRAETSIAGGNPVNLIGTTEGDFLNPEEFRARYFEGGK